jgi:hypothetical protein
MPASPSTLRLQVAVVQSILDEADRWLVDGANRESTAAQLLEELELLASEVRRVALRQGIDESVGHRSAEGQPTDSGVSTT